MMFRLKKILSASDFSSCSAGALAYARELAERTGAELHLLHVEVFFGELLASPPDPEHEQEVMQRLRAQLSAAGGV